VTCIPIAKQRLGKHIPAKRTHATEGHPLLGNRPVNKLFNNIAPRLYNEDLMHLDIELGRVLEMASKVTEKKWQERN
jgi:hypothetical protein